MKSKKTNNQELVLNINPQLYSLAAIYAACYVFIDRAYLFLEGDLHKRIEVTIRPKKKGARLEDLAGDFHNELLNQALREEIFKNNKKITELIVGKALFSANPEAAEEGEEFLRVEIDASGSYEEDPLGIAVPWEENREKKHGKKKKK